ncbi:MAG: DUF374 domain-containing protein [Pseudomonadota bacterium]
MLRQLLRRLRHSARARAILAWLIHWYLRLVYRTTRWEIIGAELREAGRSNQLRGLIAIWHGRVAMVVTEMRSETVVEATMSRNLDGDLVCRVAESFGIGTIRGSAANPDKPGRDKGGREVATGALEALARHDRVLVSFTPDGPRGPRQRCKAGMSTVAARAQVPIITFAFATRWAIVLESWDRFMLPLPFGRGAIGVGGPIPPPADGSADALERHRHALETALNEITARCDRQVGRLPMEPAA